MPADRHALDAHFKMAGRHKNLLASNFPSVTSSCRVTSSKWPETTTT
jgi:hypothetical protein